jgi:hypothetical protein
MSAYIATHPKVLPLNVIGLSVQVDGGQCGSIPAMFGCILSKSSAGVPAELKAVFVDLVADLCADLVSRLWGY